MERFSCRTQIISGPGAVQELKNLGIKSLLLVSDPFFAKNGMADRLAKLTGAEKTEIFHKVMPDPSVELAAEGTAIVKALQPDTIVALGGGSAMDCAKAMAYFSGDSVRLVAIPTTSGSGSEVTDFAILTHGGVKHPLVDSKILPDVAILDSELLQGLPPSLVADAGFDVLAHALEAFVATGAGAITDALAKDAFSAAYGALPASFAGNTAVRQKIHTAATMAGLAFNQAGLGLSHAMAHALGGKFHLPHGRLNAILLPAVIECNAHSAGAKYAKLARSAGLGGSADTIAVRNLKNALIRLRRELKLPQTLQEAGVDPREVWHSSKDIVGAVLADPCCQTNPIKVEDFMVRRILEEVTGRV
ncbi:MAG: iron-containing alcohol dehydrogenase [Oscillospiraceae bacterium]|nr:iron-containing alcohol dehydrogenase [Oscillospiraceae bacterium]